MLSQVLTALIFAGTLQGFIFAFVYFFSKNFNGPHTFYLTALILAFSLNNLQFLLPDAGIVTGYRMYQTFYIPVGSLIPVFIYFYTLVFLNPSKKIPKRLRLLYVPFFIFLCTIAIPYKIEAFLGTSDSHYKTYRFLNGIQSSFSLIYTLALIIISYVTVLRFKKQNSKTIQLEILPNNKELKWLGNTLLILLALSCFWGFALVLFFSNPELQFYFRFLWLGLSIAIYYLGHLGIYKYGILKDRKEIREAVLNTTSYAILEKTKSKNNHIITLNKKLLEEKQYLNPNLSLDLLANELQLSKSHLSRIINGELGTSFSEYINTLRIEEAKAHLENPEFSKYTILAIGLEAGFSSKTTFNTTFKKITGLTPSQYRKKISNRFQ